MLRRAQRTVLDARNLSGYVAREMDFRGDMRGDGVFVDGIVDVLAPVDPDFRVEMLQGIVNVFSRHSWMVLSGCP